MALRVPVRQRQAQLGAVSGFRQTGTAPEGRALQQVARGVGDLASGVAQGVSAVQQAQARSEQAQDETAVMEAYASKMKSKQEILDDPQNGLMAQKGRNALNNRTSTITFYDAHTKQLRDSLANERQQAAFDSMVAKERPNFMHSVDGHVRRENEVVRKQAFNATLDAARNDVVAGASRDDFITRSTGGQVVSMQVPGAEAALEKTFGAIELEGERQGWAPEVVKQMKAAEESTMHLGVINSLVQRRDHERAKQYLKANREGIDGVSLAKSKVETKMRAQALVDDAHSAADAAWNISGGDTELAMDIVRGVTVDEEGVASISSDLHDRLQALPGVDKEDVFDLMRRFQVGGEDVELLDEALERVSQRGSEQRTARRVADTPRIGILQQELFTRGNFSMDHLAFQDLSDEGKGRALKMRRAERRARGAEGRDAKRLQLELDRDGITNFKARDPWGGDDGENQTDVDINKAYSNLSSRAKDTMVREQKTQQRAKEKRGEVPRSSLRSQVGEAAGSLGIPGVEGTKVKPGGQADNLLSGMQEWHTKWAADNPDRTSGPTQDEVTEELGRRVTEGEVEGLIWNTKKRRFQLEPEEEFIEGTEVDPFSGELPPETPGGGRAPKETSALESVIRTITPAVALTLEQAGVLEPKVTEPEADPFEGELPPEPLPGATAPRPKPVRKARKQANPFAKKASSKRQEKVKARMPANIRKGLTAAFRRANKRKPTESELSTNYAAYLNAQQAPKR